MSTLARKDLLWRFSKAEDPEGAAVTALASSASPRARTTSAPKLMATGLHLDHEEQPPRSRHHRACAPSGRGDTVPIISIE